MNATAIRKAETPAKLLAACQDAGLDALLDEDPFMVLAFDDLPPRVEAAWARYSNPDLHGTVEGALADETLWQALRKVLGSAMLSRLFTLLRGDLAEVMDRIEEAEGTLAPSATIPPKPAAPPPPAAAPPSLRPGMPRAELDAWAREREVQGLLDEPVGKVPGALAVIGSIWFFFYHRGVTIADAITTAPGKTQKELTAGAPPVDLGRCVLNWLESRAKEAGEAREADARVRAGHREPALAALRPAWRRLLETRDALRAVAPPAPYDTSARVALADDPPHFVYYAKALETCGSPGRAVEVVVPLDGKAPFCRCDKEPPARCTRAVHALDAAMAWMSGALKVDPSAVATLLSTPAWARTLTDMDAFTAEETAAEDERAVIGWAVDGDGRALSVWPLRLVPKKRGDGWKVARASREDVFAADGPNAHQDRLVHDTLPERGAIAPPLPRLIRALERLVGHPHVFARGKGGEPLQVRVVDLGFRVTAGEDGSARLVPTVGGEAVEPSTLSAGNCPFVAGDRMVRWTPERGVVSVVRAPERARLLVDTLAKRGGAFPADAVPELIRRLPAVSRIAPVQAGEMVTRVPADTRVHVRLELLADDTLRVEARVRPLPGVPAQIPGDPPEELLARTPTGVVAARRDAPAEVAAAQTALAAVPLGSPLTEEPFSWLIDDPERVVEVLHALQGAGVEVEWRGAPRRVVSPSDASGVRVQVGSAREWFALGGDLDVDGVGVSLARLLEAIAARRPFVKVDEHTWIRLERRFRERLEPLADATQDGALSPVNAPLLLELQELGAKVEAPRRWTELLDRVRAAPAYAPEPPATLRAELRPYQRAGFQWLARLATWAEGAVLADDMGLGKTVQALALLLHRAELGPALVVAPTSVGFNWVRQAERFAPSLRIRLARGGDRPRAEDAPGPGDVLVTSYDLLVRDGDVLAATRFGTVVFDEAQAVKNPDTQRAKAARALQADFRVALSGTPLENRTSELWSLFSVVSPGVFGGRERFRASYALPIERDGDSGRRGALARRIRPFVLRRLKSEVATDLPPRTEVRVDVELGPEERRLYEAGRILALQELASLRGPEQQRRFQVFAALTRMRQLACHPRLVDPEAGASSAKLERLVELLRELREEGRRALVFSQFVRQLDLVGERLAEEAFRFRRIDGSTPEPQRRVEVDAFQGGDGDVFLISLKAGGTGLDLTAASDVVILDPWWNPSVEDQAADRAHRIGQTRAVTIYRLVATQTVEERILALHEQKRDLVSAILEGTGSGATLTAEELVALLHEDEAAPEPLAPSAAPAPPTSPETRGPRGPAHTAAEWLAVLESHLEACAAEGSLKGASARAYAHVGRRFFAWIGRERPGPLDSDALEIALAAWKALVRTGKEDAPLSDAASVVGVVRRVTDVP